MDISVIDQNLRNCAVPKEDDIVWYDVAKAPFVLYGAAETAPHYRRIPRLVAEFTSEGVVQINEPTAGVRARFCTDSPYIAVRVEWTVLSRMSHMPPSGINGLDLYAVRNRQYSFEGAFIPPLNAEQGFEAILYRPGLMTDYVLNFPLYNQVNRVFVGVQAAAKFQTPAKYANDLPVVFYGSSITQGGCASRPGNCYPNFLSRWLDMNYINLGFSGSAKAEEAIVKYMADIQMSAFVSDYDHNAPDAAYLEKTHLRMYQTIREKKPQIPYIILSRPDFKARDAQLKEIILNTYRYGMSRGDKYLYFVDGEQLFGSVERDACTVDGCHPNDLGFYRMALEILPTLRKVLLL